MKKFTYEDWLNDRMEYMRNMPDKELDGKFLLGANRLDELYHKHKMISEEDYILIKKHQEETHDMAAALFCSSLKNRFSKRLANIASSYRKAEIKKEILILEGELCLSERSIDVQSKKFKQTREAVNAVLEGNRQCNILKGSKYIEAKRKYENLQKGNEFQPVLIPTASYKIKAKLDYLRYLRSLAETQKLTGLESVHDERKLRAVYKIAVKEKVISCSEEDFVAAFTLELLPVEFERIVWLLKSDTGRTKGAAHLSALREFVSYATKGEQYAKEITKDLSHLFVDADGKGLKLSTPKHPNKLGSSSYIEIIDKIFRAKPL